MGKTAVENKIAHCPCCELALYHVNVENEYRFRGVDGTEYAGPTIFTAQVRCPCGYRSWNAIKSNQYEAIEEAIEQHNRLCKRLETSDED